MTSIVIDVGHSASTFPPGKGVYKHGKGYAEYNFNIKLARAIARLLEVNGVDVTVYPNDGRDVPLRQRTDYYNKESFDLVVSVHANANSNASVNGRCVFYWHSSANSRRLAIAVRDEIRNAGYSTHGSGLHESKVGSWTNLHIVRETRMPTVLIEHGFMTGNKDFELVFGNKQGKYIQDMAEADSKAILKYLGISYTIEPVKGSEPIVTKEDNLYRVQVGAFSDKKNAERLAKELKDKGYPVHIPDVKEVTVSEPKPKPTPKPTPKPKPTFPQSVSGARLVKEENAFFKADSAIKVRTAPSTNSTHTGTLPKDASINYFAVYEGNGYRWLRYNTANGVRYLPYRRLTGNTDSWGTFHSTRP